jgi:hypothetical protein
MSTFNGNNCDSCGGTLRYKSNNNCVHCSRERSIEQSKKRSIKKFGTTPRIDATQRKFEAKELGLSHYQGSSCKNCGTSNKYVSNNRCVKCSLDDSKSRNVGGRRSKAPRYESEPCNKCGGTERYQSNGQCPTCKMAYNKRKLGCNYENRTK